VEWVLWTAGAVGALVAIDRLALWAESRGWLYWRRRKPATTGGDALGELIEVFQPSRQNVTRERRRQQTSAELPESGAPPLGVDLDAGTVRLRHPGAGRPRR
jgi:hypothetical protein